MELTRKSFILFALVATNISLSGCSSEVDQTLTPEQHAEINRSAEDLKKRGWGDDNLKPVTREDLQATEAAMRGDGSDTPGTPATSEK